MFRCRLCNEFKGSQISAVDPLSGAATTLFHPRREVWAEHFVWDETSVTLLGLTATGRATIIALQINHPIMVAARRRWVSVGWHP